MKVLVAGIQWPPETFLARLIRSLPAQGIDVVVACAGRPSPDWRAVPGTSLLYTPPWDISRSRRVLTTARHAASAVLRAPTEIRRVSPFVAGTRTDRLRQWYRLLPLLGREADVVYFPWNLAANAYEPLLELGIPFVVSCRGGQVNVYPHVPGREHVPAELERTFVRATAVHCVSQDILDEATLYGLDPAKARVIRPAIDTTVFVPAEAPRRAGERIELVTTGSLIWRKGLEYMLVAFAKAVQAGLDARLTIIGSGPERQRVLYTRDDLGLGDRVRLVGKLDPAKVVETLQTSDVFVLASLSEGISNAVLEGMGCALPVVTTDCGGMTEAVTDGVEGFVVPVRDVDAMAARFVELGRDSALRARMGQLGRARVQQDFELRDQARAFAALFRDAASGRIAG